jgi:predicted aldo/keto reductase-like oxidoreductase
VDVLLMHAVGSMTELDTLLGPGGAIEAAEKARAAGKVKFIGISMHGVADVLINALQRYPFSAVMTTINYYDRFNFPEIEDTLVPLAHEKGAGIILMKPVGDGLLWKSPEPAFRYAFGQPVSVVVAGINNREMLDADLRYVEGFQPLSPEELEDIVTNAPELGNYVCRQCNKCLPCPQGLNIPLIFKYEGYFDRQMADGVVTNAAEYALKDRLRFWFGNNPLATERYMALEVRADKCNACGECLPRCPYHIDIVRKMSIVDYKMGGNKIY